MSSKKKTSVRAGAKSTNKNTTKTRLAAAIRPDLDKGRAAALAKLAGQPTDHADAPGPDPTAPEVVPPADAADTAATVAHDAAPAKAAPKRGKGAKAAPKPTSPKPAMEPKAKKEKAPKPPKVKKVSCLDAAAQVLAASTTPMRATEMIEAMTAKDLWKPGAGKTPDASLYAAIVREIAAKGEAARFKKHDKGQFVYNRGSLAPFVPRPLVRRITNEDMVVGAAGKPTDVPAGYDRSDFNA